MGETEISWTHREGTVGRTWNPVQGCRRVSAGCERCYAERLAARFAESGWSQGLINLKTRKWNGEARLAAHKLAEPLSWRKPATVFVNSMSDLFYEGFTNEQIAAVFGVMAAAPQHTFQVLTKRARRMREWFEWVASTGDPISTCLREAFCILDTPDARNLSALERAASYERPTRWPLPSVWLGVSVENQAAADERIPDLLATPAAVRFLSCEPLLGELEICKYLCCGYCTTVAPDHCPPGRSFIDWVIAGCESGPRARACDVAWLRSLRDQCAAALVPFFLKQAVEAEVPAAELQRWLETGSFHGIGSGDGSREKGRGFGGPVIELPYLDGAQHAAFPEGGR